MKKLHKPTMLDMDLMELYIRRQGFASTEPFTIGSLPKDAQEKALAQTARLHRDLFANRQQ